MVAELKLAHSVRYQMTSGESNQYTLAITGGTLHTVNLTENTCSCSFRRTWLMPCRHIFNVRLSLHISIFEEGMVSKRWLRSYQSAGMFDQAVYSTNNHASCASGIVSEQGHVHVSNLSTKSKLSGTLACNQKFQKMQTLCQKLATMASLCGMPQFREKYAQIETLVNLWEKNVPVVISTPEFKHQESGKMKALNPQQLDDAEQVAVIEEDPSPLNTDESNEELFIQADHLLAAASSVYGQMVVTEEEHLPSDRQQDEPMIVTEDDCLPPYPELSSEDSEQITSAVKSPLQPMVSTEMCPRVRDNDSMMDLAEPQYQARLKLGLLKTDMKIKPYVKARGKPKHTGTLWPSRSIAKKKKQCSEKENEKNQNSDELPHAKSVCVDKPFAKKRCAQAGTAAYLMKQRLKQKRKESCALSPAAVIELETEEIEQSGTSGDRVASVEFTVNGQDILSEDIHIMKSKSKWLNEQLINAGQRMLAKDYPNTAGLYDVGLSDILAYPDESRSDFIQILNVAGTHWVCLTHKDCKPATVKVYDSRRTGDLPLLAKEVVAALVKSKLKEFTSYFLMYSSSLTHPVVDFSH